MAHHPDADFKHEQPLIKQEGELCMNVRIRDRLAMEDDEKDNMYHYAEMQAEIKAKGDNIRAQKDRTQKQRFQKDRARKDNLGRTQPIPQLLTGDHLTAFADSSEVDEKIAAVKQEPGIVKAIQGDDDFIERSIFVQKELLGPGYGSSDSALKIPTNGKMADRLTGTCNNGAALTSLSRDALSDALRAVGTQAKKRKLDG